MASEEIPTARARCDWIIDVWLNVQPAAASARFCATTTRCRSSAIFIRPVLAVGFTVRVAQRLVGNGGRDYHDYKMSVPPLSHGCFECRISTGPPCSVSYSFLVLSGIQADPGDAY